MKIPDAKVAVDKEWMEEARDNSSMGFGKSQEQEKGYSGSTKNKVHFATLMEICHLENVELEPTLSMYRGRVVLRGDIVKDDSGACAVFTEQSASCCKKLTLLQDYQVVMDKQLMQYQRTPRTNLRMLPDCSKFIETECPDVGIRLPRHKWPKSWESIEDPVVLLERHLYGHPLAGLLWEKQFEEAFFQNLMRENSDLGMYVRSSETRVISVSICGWHENGCKEAKYGSYVEEIDEKCGYWRIHNIFLTVCTWDALSVNANRMTIIEQYTKMFASRTSVATEKLITWVAEASRTNSSVVLRHGGTRLEMRWAILWTSEQESGAIVQNFKPLFGWSSMQIGGTRICWRIVRSLLTNCLNMFVFGTHWTTWHIVVRQQACEISHKMVWQTLGKADFLRSITQTISDSVVMWDTRHSIVDWVCFKPQTLLVILRTPNQPQEVSFVYFWKQNICPSHLDVQEANCCLPQFHRIWNHFSGCWITYGWVVCSWSLGWSLALGDWSVTFN